MRRGFWLAVLCLVPSLAYGQVTLEHPLPGQPVTGIGLVSGWACEAESVTVRLQEGAELLSVPYGGSRPDTEGVCNDDGLNSFSLLVNWNRLGAGTHTLTLYVNGEQAATRNVQVVTFGEEFARDFEGRWTLSDWPKIGTNSTIAWTTGRQNIEIVNVHTSERTPEVVKVERLLGSWRFEQKFGGHNFTLEQVDPGPDHTPFAEGILIYTYDDGSVDEVAIYGESNTFGYFALPLRDFEVSWRYQGYCLFYVFDLNAANDTATGYFWAVQGADWAECFAEDNATVDGPYDATGRKIPES